MQKSIDYLAIFLFAISLGAFGFGLYSLHRQEDLRAFYMLIVGALALRSSTEILRPKGSSG